MRVGILTSNDLRHRYLVNALARRFEVAAVGYQDTGYSPITVADDAPDEPTAELVRRHFDERRRQEERYFGHDAGRFADNGRGTAIDLDVRSLNSPETVRFLDERNVDVVVVYGTSLIKPPLLTRFAGRLINMHLGLSPYYRGTATNFYPLVNGEPQYVGATIHLIDAGIDSGPIVHHARPDIVAHDGPHTVGCKAILAGIEALSRALTEFEAGRMETVPQWPAANSKLYLRRDYRSSHVVQLYEQIASGLFSKYAERRVRVEHAIRLID